MQSATSAPTLDLKHPLLVALRDLQQRISRSIFLGELGKVLLSLLCWSSILLAFDFWQRPESWSGRLALSAAWYLGIATSLIYLGWQSRKEIDLLALASSLEAHFPALQGALTTAIEFLLHPRPETGSLRLKELLISQTWEKTQHCDLRSTIRPQAVWQRFLPAFLLGLGLGSAALQFPQHASAGLSRLFAPQLGLDWPRENQLRFLAPPAWAERGATVEFIVADENSRPVTSPLLILRGPSGKEEQHPLQPLAGRYVFQLSRIEHDWEYRATGGDDDTLPWRKVRIAEPIRLIELQFEIAPAPYVRQPSRSVAPPISLVTGSKLIVRGQAECELRQARLLGPQRTLEGKISSASAFSFEGTAPWTTADNGTWQLELQDSAGAILRPRSWEMTVAPDLPPKLTLLEPTAGKRITPSAVVRVAGLAVDDVALAEVRVVGERDSVAQATSSVAAETGDALRLWSADDSQAVAQTEFLELLDETRLPRSGERLRVRFFAKDALGQTSEVVTRELQIVSTTELQKELLAQQTGFAQELHRARQLLLECEKICTEPSEARTTPFEQLSPVLHRCERLEHELLTNDDALAAKLQTWLETHRDNRLPVDPLTAAWERIYRELSLDFSSGLKQIQTSLQESRIDGQSNFASQSERLRGLHEQISRWLRELETHESQEAWAAELRELAAREEQLREQLGERQLAWLSRPAEQTDDDRQRLAQTQSEIARKWEQWLSRVVKQEQLAPNSAGLSEFARELAIGENLRVSITAMRAGRAAQSLEGVERALQSFAQLLQRLQGTAEVKPLADAAWEAWRQSLTELLSEQQQLDAEWQSALEQPVANRSAAAAQFAQKERALATRVTKQAEEMDSGPLAASRSALRAAAEALQRSAAAAERSAWRDSLAQSLHAMDDLKLAQEQLASAQQGAEAAEQSRQLNLLLHQLQEIVPNQAKLHEAAKRLLDARPTGGGWSRSQRVEWETLGEQQHTLAKETQAANQTTIPAVTLQLNEINDLQESAAVALAAAAASTINNTPDFLSRQKQALAKLQALIQILSAEIPTAAANRQLQNDRDSQGKPESPTASRSAAELRLILQMQRDIGMQLIELPADGDARTAMLRGLGTKQGQLADLVAAWHTSEKSQPPELPTTNAAWEQRIAQELAGGDDLGTKQTTPWERISRRMRLLGGLLTQQRPSQFAPLQSAVEQELEAIVSALQQQQRKELQRSLTADHPRDDNEGRQSPSAGADPSTQPQKPATVEFAPGETRDLARKVWGHLPPKTREELLQMTGEEFLPEYAPAIREYYRRLAKQRPPIP